MKVKKFTTIILLLFCIISLVSCGAPSEVKQEAKERLEKYKPVFEQKVKDTLQAFIRGIEDEKGIDKDNEQFQKSMDCALKYLKRLSEELGIDFE